VVYTTILVKIFSTQCARRRKTWISIQGLSLAKAQLEGGFS